MRIIFEYEVLFKSCDELVQNISLESLFGNNNKLLESGLISWIHQPFCIIYNL